SPVSCCSSCSRGRRGWWGCAVRFTARSPRRKSTRPGRPTVREQGRDDALGGHARWALQALRRYRGGAGHPPHARSRQRRRPHRPQRGREAGALGRGRAALVERAMAQLAKVRMTHAASRYPSEFSYGKQKLISLARALMNDGNALLLDEPIAGVEGPAYDALTEVIRDEAAA